MQGAIFLTKENGAILEHMKGTTESKAPAPSKSPKPEKHGAGRKTEKQRLQERLAKAGVIGVEKMTKAQLRSELERIKNEGGNAPDLRQGNTGNSSLSKDQKVVEIKERHLMEEVEVVVTDRGTNEVKKQKKPRLVALLDMLAHEGLKNKNIPAAKEYLDRTLGKSKQEIEHSGEIKVEEQRLPTKAEKAAAAAYLKALDEDE